MSEVEKARKFVLGNPDAMRRDHPKHLEFVRAAELVEQARRERLLRITQPFDGPAVGRMSR